MSLLFEVDEELCYTPDLYPNLFEEQSYEIFCEEDLKSFSPSTTVQQEPPTPSVIRMEYTIPQREEEQSNHKSSNVSLSTNEEQNERFTRIPAEHLKRLPSWVTEERKESKPKSKPAKPAHPFATLFTLTSEIFNQTKVLLSQSNPLFTLEGEQAGYDSKRAPSFARERLPLEIQKLQRTRSAAMRRRWKKSISASTKAENENSEMSPYEQSEVDYYLMPFNQHRSSSKKLKIET